MVPRFDKSFNKTIRQQLLKRCFVWCIPRFQCYRPCETEPEMGNQFGKSFTRAHWSPLFCPQNLRHFNSNIIYVQEIYGFLLKELGGGGGRGGAKDSRSCCFYCSLFCFVFKFLEGKTHSRRPCRPLLESQNITRDFF